MAPIQQKELLETLGPKLLSKSFTRSKRDFVDVKTQHA